MDGGRLVGRTALVTGAGSGIGKAIAGALASEQAAVAIADRDAKAADATAAELSSRGASALGVEMEVTATDSVQAAFDRAQDRYGPVTVLVNNAGIYPMCPIDEMSEREWDAVLDTNLKGSFLCCADAIHRMKAKGLSGSIVNVASTAALMARPFISHYAASKAGLVQFSKVVAIETARYGIRVNALCPGLVETPTVRAGAESGGHDEHRAKIKRIPMSRPGHAEEVARAALFLASDDSSYVTGAALVVDGGYTAGDSFSEVFA